MDKTYQPKQIEQKHYQHWEAQHYFKPNQNGSPYCIMIPPPNVTGTLHMGHAFQQTIMDALTRYHRMMGHNTLWQTGTDHAGIATQMVVEQLLSKQGISKHDLGRDSFIQRIWEWKEQSGGTIKEQMKRLGNSVDWESERFTMDAGMSKAVNEVFVRLYNEGLIYRGKRLVNWDPVFHTAISDLEVENHDEMGKLWHLRYPLENNQTTLQGLDYLVVATTRPETVLGDCAIAVHPEDERYQHLIGGSVMLPIANRRIPIIADEYVDREFGTGCVKITPAHDFNDYAIGQRHGLPLINIFNANAEILSVAEVYTPKGIPDPQLKVSIPEHYATLERYKARETLIQEFTQLGLLDSIKDHPLTIPKGDRSGATIEPLLTDQWYVKATELAQPAIDAVTSGEIEFVPKMFENEYFQWMNNIQDWCISRQLWWGHQIPAWYDAQGNIYVGHSEAAIRSTYGLDHSLELSQDQDVLDTWFSSALWSFSTLGWPDKQDKVELFHPTNVLVTGFDIIFFWVARMIMMSLHFLKNKDGSRQIPFQKIYVTGLIRDENGQKMSKSKGNVLDPIDLIDGISVDDLVRKRVSGMMQPKMAEKVEAHTLKSFPEGFAESGTDALRFTLASLASLSRDINFDIKRLEGNRNFCNKLWNAARLVHLNVFDEASGNALDCGQHQGDMSFSLADRWITSKLQTLIEEVHKQFKQYRFDLMSQALYSFIWEEYCSWYIELSKPLLWSTQSSTQQLRGTRFTLVNVLDTLLKLLHPIMPFITEEIWQGLKPVTSQQSESIMIAHFPEVEKNKIDFPAEQDLEWVKQVITGIRNIRGELNIPLSKALTVLLHQGNADDQRRYKENEAYLKQLAKLESLTWINDNESLPPCAQALVGHLKVLVPMKGLIDVAAEQKRIQKEIDKTQNELLKVERKLQNTRFIQNAPHEVVAKEKQKAMTLSKRSVELKQQSEQLDAL